MAFQNDETRRDGNRARASVTVSRQIDSAEDIAPASFLQASRLTRRFNLSPALAAQVAELVFAVPETWGSRK